MSSWPAYPALKNSLPNGRDAPNCTQGVLKRAVRKRSLLAHRDLAGLGVPKLRALFLEIFGHHTASNNGAWLRRKLCEKPDATRGRGRSASIRKRDQGAAIWTTGAVKNITQVGRGPVCRYGDASLHALQR